MASEYISKFTWSHCGQRAELLWYPKGIFGKEQSFIEADHRKRVREYDRVSGCEERHKFHRSMKACPDHSISIIPVSPYSSVIPVSQCVPHRLPPVTLNGGGGEKQMFLTQRPPSTLLSTLNWHFKVLRRFSLNTICRQTDCMDRSRVTEIDNSCHIMM